MQPYRVRLTADDRDTFPVVPSPLAMGGSWQKGAVDQGFSAVIRRNPCARPVLPARLIAVVVNGNAKILAEEPEEAAERVLPVAVAVRHAQHLARYPGRIARPLDRNVRHPALVALEKGKHALVAAVHVLAKLQLAGVVDERRLIGEVDRGTQRLGELDVLLGGAEHALDALLGVVLLRQHEAE